MFCKYCGNQVPDGYLCNCPESQAARESAPVATAAPNSNAVGDAFNNLPVAAKTLLVNAEGPGTKVITAAIFAFGTLILNMLSWVLIVAGLMGKVENEMGKYWELIEEAFEGVYGYAFLGGLWTWLVPIAFAMLVIILGQLIRKEDVDFASAFTTSACISVAPSAIFLVGALFTTFLDVVGVFLILVGIIVYLASCYKLVGKFVPNTRGIVGGLIAAAVVAVAIVIMVLVIGGLLDGFAEEFAEAMASIVGVLLKDSILGLI